jgi:hypothetical protein
METMPDKTNEMKKPEQLPIPGTERLRNDELDDALAVYDTIQTTLAELKDKAKASEQLLAVLMHANADALGTAGGKIYYRHSTEPELLCTLGAAKEKLTVKRSPIDENMKGAQSDESEGA